MQLKEFITRVAFVAFCIGVLLHLFYPRYEFIDARHRCNTVSGAVEEYSNCSYNRGWSTN